MNSHLSLRRRLLLSVAAIVGCVAVVTAVEFPEAYGAFLPRVTGNSNTAATARYFTCANAALGEAATKSYFTYPFSEASGATANDSSGNNRPGSYNNGAATMYGVANSGANAVCPRDGRTVITLNGFSQYVSGPTTVQTGPAAFSIEIWFRTTIPQGRLIGFGNARTGASAAATNDRQLYIDTGGFLRFGVFPSSGRVSIAASTNVLNTTWHHAVGTLSPTAGMTLYLDGAPAASDPNTKTAGSYNGYWKMGYDDLSSWPARPFSNYFSGSLAFASVYSYALSADQVAAHYVAGR